MRLKVAIGYNVARQKERVAEFKISSAQARAIVTDYFNKMDYDERELWMIKQKIKTVSTQLI